MNKGHYFFILIVSMLFYGCIGNKSSNAALAKNSSESSNNEVIKVLIVDGFSNHDWKQTSKVTKSILEKSGLFDVSISTAPTKMADTILKKWNPDFKSYDVIIQNCNNLRQKEIQWPRRVQINFENYIKDGGGLYVLHSGNNSFEEWEAYNNMIGLGWRKASNSEAIEITKDKTVQRIPVGSGKNTTHGARFDAVIQVLNRHAINSDYPEKWMTPNMELYLFPRGPAKNITILSFANDPISKRNWPVEWTVKYGKGNIYNSSMGHLWKGDIYPESYRCVGFQTTMIRATEWLAKGTVTYKLPENFPMEQSTSLMPELKIEP